MKNMETKTFNDHAKSVYEIIEKIEVICSQEIEFTKNSPINYQQENVITKSRLLQDLNVAIRQMDSSKIDSKMDISLKKLKLCVENNMQYFGAYIDSLREIIDIISSSTQDLEKDGTYKVCNFGKF